MSELPTTALRLLDEARASGLVFTELPGNSAKIRLVLDLRAALPESGTLRVLDVGCGGLYSPFNVWEPLLPFADRLDLTGIDLAFLDETRARAAELGFPIDVRKGSVLEIEKQFGADSFDVVVSTQVLEHVRKWREALRAISAVLRPGGLLLLTCDNGDLARPPTDHVRLTGKRAYARLAELAPSVTRIGGRFLSGDWERPQRLEELRDGARDAGLEIERIAYYALRDLKDAKGDAGTRLLSLAFEEALSEERPEGFDPGRYRILYLRARQPFQPPVSPL